MTSTTTRTFKINNLVLNELEDICKMINISKTSFLEIALIEKMARIRSYTSEKEEINKIYDYVKKVSKNGLK